METVAAMQEMTGSADGDDVADEVNGENPVVNHDELVVADRDSENEVGENFDRN